MEIAKKIWFQACLIILGITVIINGISTEQNGAFMIGAFALLIAGAISLVAGLVEISKKIRTVISVVLGVMITFLAYADYQSIKGPIEFQNEKVKRYEHVIQQLKDIRTAELAFKNKYQKYTSSIDSLKWFVGSDSIEVVKAFGEVPDTMTLENAIRAKIVTRDTVSIPVYDTLFGARHQEGRAHKFILDSLGHVPFTKDGKFILEASTVERSGANVPVFQATDGAPFDKTDVKKVGSLNEPKTNGNWE